MTPRTGAPRGGPGRGAPGRGSVRYQGRALQARPRARPRGPLARLARVAAALLLAAGLARLPWDDLRRRYAVVTAVRVEGARTLDPARVAAAAGVEEGQDLIALDSDRARQRLLLHPRIADARVSRAWPRAVRIRIEERVPVLLVRHGAPWEIDSAGVLLAPLAEGVVADVPLLSGPRFDALPEGARVTAPAVRRGLAWARALSAPELGLLGQVSEVDVGAREATVLVLLDGTRVLAPAWPPTTRDLSALRVVLADLERRGAVAHELDVRFHGQVIVRPAAPPVDSTRQAAGV